MQFVKVNQVPTKTEKYNLVRNTFIFLNLEIVFKNPNVFLNNLGQAYINAE
jgi:hypothetical protein